ncbi:MAG: tetratricopeptide repeat protein [Thermoplasmata archaeon]
MPLLKRKSTVSSLLKSVSSMYNDAKEYEKSNPEKAKLTYKKILPAISEFDNVEELNQNALKISEILTDAGIALFRLDDKEVSIDYFEKAKTLDPKNAEAWFNLGKVLVSLNRQLPYALICLKEAFNNNPDNINAKILLADIYRIQGEKDKALEIYKEIINRVDDRLDIINKILKLDENNKDALLEKVEYLKSKDKLDELPEIYKKLAIIDKNEEYLDEGLKLYPDNLALLLEKAIFLINDKLYTYAKEIILNILNTDPENIDALELNENLDRLMNPDKPEIEKKKGELASNIFENIFETKTETKKMETETQPDQNIDHVKSSILSGSETLEQDLDAFKENLNKLPEILNDLEVPDNTLVRIVEYLISIQDFDVAKAMAARLKDSLKNNFYNGYILFKAGNIEGSEAFFNEILKVSMDHAPTWYYKAAIMAWKKNESACKNFLLMAIKKDPSLKYKASSEEYFNVYKSSPWFKSLVS